MKRPRNPIPALLEMLSGYSGQKFREESANFRGAGWMSSEDQMGPLISGGGHCFRVDYRAKGEPSSLAPFLAEQLERALHLAESDGSPVPLLVVPFMGESAARVCARHRINWIDLSGNASVHEPGLHIHVEGKPNQFKERGRKSNPFAAKSSRVSHFLLNAMESGKESFAQTEIASACGLDRGFVSRIVGRLSDLALISHDPEEGVVVRDPRLLLQSWRDHHCFPPGHLVKGALFARSAEELRDRVAGALSSSRINFAFGGLSSAWLYAPFAAHRLVTVYTDAVDVGGQLRQLGFVESEKGANLWLIEGADAGLLQFVREKDGFPCISPIQNWLDLQHHPERGEEAAEALQKACLPWLSGEE